MEVVLLTKHKHPSIVGFYEGFFYKKTLWLMLELAHGGEQSSDPCTGLIWTTDALVCRGRYG